jgi:hypothetical protein
VGNFLDFIVGIKSAPFKRGLNDMREEASRVKQKISRDFSRNTFGAISSALAGAFTIGAVKSLIDDFAKIEHQAKRFGASAVDIQKVGGAAEEVDADINMVAKSLQKLGGAAQKAADGGKKQGDQFKKLGVDAEAFAKADMPGRLILLSEGYQKATGDGEKMSKFMTALGPKAGALIPLLAKGPEELAKTLERVPALGDGAVKALATASERIKQMKNTMAGWFIAAAQGVEKTGAAIAFWINRFTVGYEDALKTLNRQNKDIEEKYTARETPTGGDASGPDEDDQEETKRMAALRDQIAESERKARLEEKEDLERLIELYAERDALLQEANDETEDGLEAKKKALAIDEEAKKLSEQIADKAEQQGKHIADMRIKQEEALKEALDRERATDEKNALDTMSPEQKATFLQGKQRRLADEATDLEHKASLLNPYDDEEKARQTELRTEASKKRNEAKGLQREIDADQEQKPEKESRRHGPLVFASQFAEVGLGGNASATAIADKQLAELKRSNEYLRDIASALGGEKTAYRSSGFTTRGITQKRHR